MNRRSRLLRVIGMSSLLIALVLGGSGCKFLNSILGKIDFFQREFSNVEDILNRAIVDVDANSANWQLIIQKAIDDLPQAEAVVRQDLQNLMQRGIATAGLEVRCDIAYLGDMLAQGLQGILAKFKHQPVPPLKAVVCDASPAAVDMNLPPNNRNNIEVYGYNLDQAWIKLLHVRATSTTDVSAQFSVTSPFKRVINLGSTGVALQSDSLKLRMDLGAGAMRDIPVIQAWPSICTTRDFNTNSASLQVVPTHVGPGDNEFAGHGPCTRADARIYVAANGTELHGALSVDIWECPDDMSKIQSDYTEAMGSTDRVLFTTNHDERIIEVRGPTSARLEYIDTTTSPDSKADSGLVVRWNMIGDTDGDDVGRSSVTATFNSVHLVLRKSEDCVTEEELARLIAQKALSQQVQDRLRLERPSVLERSRMLKDVIKVPHI
jgi:hypothetical protein